MNSFKPLSIIKFYVTFLFSGASLFCHAQNNVFHGGLLGTAGYFIGQSKMDFEQPLSSRMVYGGNFLLGGIRQFANMKLQYAQNTAVIAYPIDNKSSLYRREVTQFWALGLRVNPMAKTKYHPFFEMNFGTVNLHLKNYSNDMALDSTLPMRSFFMRKKMVQFALGYSFSSDGFRIEPFISSFWQKKGAYPYLLRYYAGINFGYFWNEKADR